MATSPVQLQQDQIQQALTLLTEPGQVIELRVPSTSKGTQSGYFDDIEKLAEAACQLSGQGPGVYITINPVDPNLLARANNRVREYVKQGESSQDKDVLRRKIFPIDFDAVRVAGISSSDGEHRAAVSKAVEVRKWLTAMGWPLPILANSGNGAHLVYGVDLPNDDASKKLIKQALEALGAQFDDDQVTVDPTTSNAGRLWKLYGTQVWKGDPLPDRPHRMAGIIQAPDRLEPVPLELLQQLADMAPTAKQPEPRGNSNGVSGSKPYGTGDYSTLDVVAWFQGRDHYGRAIGDGKHSVLCPWTNEHTDQHPADYSDTVVWEADGEKWPVLH